MVMECYPAGQHVHPAMQRFETATICSLAFLHGCCSGWFPAGAIPMLKRRTTVAAETAEATAAEAALVPAFLTPCPVRNAEALAVMLLPYLSKPSGRAFAG